MVRSPLRRARAKARRMGPAGRGGPVTPAACHNTYPRTAGRPGVSLSRDLAPRSAPEVAVFVAGLSSLGLEILAGRIVAPAFGSSLYTWGSIIGVFLAALALGYHHGGRRAAERASTPVIAGVLLLAALYVAAVLAASAAVLDLGDALPLPPRLAPLAPVVLLFGPPVYLLGLVSPYAAELADAEGTGGAAGRVYAVGTAGSIAGAFGTTFVLVPEVGLVASAAGFGVLLVATAGWLVWRERGGPPPRRWLLRGLLVTLALTAGVVVHDSALAYTGDVVVREETAYQQLTVVDRGGVLAADRPVRTLYLDGAPQSAAYLEDGRPLVEPYVFDYPRYLHLSVAFADDVDRVLFVGGGGFSAPRRFAAEYPDVEVDVVELDPAVVDVARAHFGLEESDRLRVHVGDGRAFLERTDRTYDVIVLDAFRRDRAPFHLTTAEFMALAASRLDDDGVLVANVISAASGPASQFYRAEYATVQTAFPQVYAFPTVGGPVIQNVVLVATKRETVVTRADLAARVAQADVGVPLDDAVAHYRGPGDVRTSDVPVLRDDHAPVDRLLDPQLGRRYVISQNGTPQAVG